MGKEQPLFFTRRTDDKNEPTIKNLEDEPLLPMEEIIPEKQEELPLPEPPERHDGEIANYVHEHNFEVLFGGAKDQLISVLETVKGDPKAVELIHETLSSIFRYVETIYTMETRTKILGFRLEGDAFKEQVSRLDSSRKKAHDVLIGNLNATTRYLNENFQGQVPETGIYNGDKLHLVNQVRHAIGDWAIEVEHEILLDRAR